jgi:hypothetical protein
MEPIRPYWFNMRQGKAEPAGENVYRLTAPNLAESFISIRQAGDQQWVAVVRSTLDGPDVVVGEKTYANPVDAWYAAFELYRNQFVV